MPKHPEGERLTNSLTILVEGIEREGGASYLGHPLETYYGPSVNFATAVDACGFGHNS